MRCEDRRVFREYVVFPLVPEVIRASLFEEESVAFPHVVAESIGDVGEVCAFLGASLGGGWWGCGSRCWVSSGGAVDGGDSEDRVGVPDCLVGVRASRVCDRVGERARVWRRSGGARGRE